jgi:hypothetical protein
MQRSLVVLSLNKKIFVKRPFVNENSPFNGCHNLSCGTLDFDTVNVLQMIAAFFRVDLEMLYLFEMLKIS